MFRILWNGRSGMIAQQQKLDSISNNIANINTEGYKRVDVSFQDLVYETLNRKGYPVTENGDRKVDPYNGTGVKATDWIRDDKQGNLMETNRKEDLAIDGKGYFRVTVPDGQVAYTRNGSFNIDAQGNLVDKSGNKVEILNVVPGTKLTEGKFIVNNHGEVYLGEGANARKVGDIQLYNVVGQDSFRSIGDNLYVPKDQTVTVNREQDYSIQQGYLEGSNVDMASEMTDMIMTQRAFELNSRGIKTADDMWGMANNLRGK